MSVTAPRGFVAGGIACGIKASGDRDLAIVATADGQPVAAAGVFTQNKATAAPVQVSRAHLVSGTASAVVLNSGCANAATGAQGRADAERMCALTADGIGARADDVLVCSTGLIGFYLPMDCLDAGIPKLTSALSADGGTAAAEAIMTTDTMRKEALTHGPGFVVGGMAKGAAMLAPSMATMLAVLTTDASATPPVLQAALARAVKDSFNIMSVDGCTSTNDTVLVLANGNGEPVDQPTLTAALKVTCHDLAVQMVSDAEGATKVITVRVTGAVNNDEARVAARKVAQSQLVKCSFYGADPYWGRIVSELGSAGVAFDPDRVRVSYGDTCVCDGGVAAAHDVGALTAHMAERHVTVTADLGLGPGDAYILTNDLTHAYIDENMGTS